MNLLYDLGRRPVKAMVLLLLSTLVPLPLAAQAGAGVDPGWAGGPAARVFTLPQAPVRLADRHIGILADMTEEDQQTREAFDFLQKNCTDLIIGSLVSQLYGRNRELVLKRSARTIRELVSPPFSLSVSAIVEKGISHRGFKTKIRGLDSTLLADITVMRVDDGWVFLDIQNVARTPALSADRAEARIRLEEEGWIPYGN